MTAQMAENTCHQLFKEDNWSARFFCCSFVCSATRVWHCLLVLFFLERMGLDKYTCFQNFLHVDNKVTPYVSEVFASFKTLPDIIIISFAAAC